MEYDKNLCGQILLHSNVLLYKNIEPQYEAAAKILIALRSTSILPN